MSENNINIQIRIASISEVSFMMSPSKMPDDVTPESIQLGFSSQIQPDIADDRLVLIFGIRYELKGEVILDCIYRFEFEVKSLKQFISINEDGSITVSSIMPHLISVAAGTMRGILVVKTAGTNFSKFPLPMIDPEQLTANLSAQ